MNPAGLGLDNLPHAHPHFVSLFIDHKTRAVKSITWHACAHSLLHAALCTFLPFVPVSPWLSTLNILFNAHVLCLYVVYLHFVYIQAVLI